MKISIILPLYNAEKFIEEAITSVQYQTYNNWELIIIDDQSTDSSYKIASKFLTDKRINIFQNDLNRGLSYSLNKGIGLASGSYIARMDADDICLRDRLSVQLEYLQKHPYVDVLGANCVKFDEEGKFEVSNVITSNASIKAYLFIACPFIHPTMMIKRSYLIKFNLTYDHQYYRAEDYALWGDMIDSAYFANIENVVLKYRVLSNSETRLADLDKIKKFEVFTMIHRSILKKINVELSSQEQYIYTSLMLKWNIVNIKGIKISEIEIIFYKILNFTPSTFLLSTFNLFFLSLQHNE